VTAAPIEGAMVRLRPIAREVATQLLAGRSPEGFAFAAGYPSRFSLEVMDLLAGPRAAETGPGSCSYFVERQDDDTIVGEIGYAFDEQAATATLGYSIVEPCWGRGYATDASRALVERLRADSRVERIVATAPVAHGASRRVMEKAGMVLCDQRLQDVDGTLVEVAVYEA
jgi:RimJ/RimL family protein N-acetyltransferase